MFVALCDVDPLRPEYFHMLAQGSISYILQTASGRMDGRDVYGVMRWIPMIVFFAVGTQLQPI